MQLHDSLASSLSVIAKLSEALREQLSDNAELAPKVDLLGEQARASLSEIREIIQLLDNPDGAPAQSLDIASELDRVKSVAEASKIDFKVEFDNDDLNLVSTETEKLLMAFLREATTNLLKYAAPASKANLSISCNENSIEVMAKNYYLDVVRDAVLTSGKGLKTIRKKIESAGGQLDVWTVDSCWYVHAEIPLVKGDSSARR